MKYFYFLFVATLLFTSCRKEPGFGGLGKISGKVYAYDYTTSGNLDAEGYAPDIQVFIGVAGDSSVLKKQDTDFNGAYSFEGLRKGKYNIWVYTDCDTCTGNIKAVIQTVELSSNKSDSKLPDFVINI